MARTTGRTTELLEVRRQVEQWRATRNSQGPMPELLWAAAAGAAKSLGVSRVASELKVGYAGLKQRVDASSRSSPRRARAGGGFVEVTGAQVLASPALPRASADAVIEYARGDGSRLTITVPAGSRTDLCAVVAALRGP
jgi:hypothetical protein